MTRMCVAVYIRITRTFHSVEPLALGVMDVLSLHHSQFQQPAVTPPPRPGFYSRIILLGARCGRASTARRP